MNLNNSSILVRCALPLLLLACRTAPPKVDVSIYAGVSATQTVQRNPKDHFGTGEPRFDTGAWLSYSDIKKLFDTILQCKQWPDGIEKMTPKEAAAALGVYLDVSQKATGGVDGTHP